jgi:hypothetical protein
MSAYMKDYIDACRTRVGADLRAYRKQVGKAPSKEFAIRFFIDQVLLLDYTFVHRLTDIEGKDGNPLNEVRVLCNSLRFNHDKLQIEKLPGVAELCWRQDQSPAGEVPPEAQGRRRRQTERRRLRSALQSFLRGD